MSSVFRGREELPFVWLCGLYIVNPEGKEINIEA